MMPVIREVLSKKDLRDFVFLPEKIHATHKSWVHPLYFDERAFYSPKKNKFFSDCDTILLLAFRDKEPVGRIMGIISHKYNRLHNENNGRFFAFECYNDTVVAAALLGAIEKWCFGKGMDRIIGPFGFSEKDPQGFMIEGFDQPMIIATNYNLPYMADLVSACGYQKEIDCVEYMLPVPEDIPEIYRSVCKRTLENNSITVREFNKRRELRPVIKPVFELINETYAPIFGFNKLTDKEIDYFANRYLSFINPRFVKVVYNKRNELIAFALAMPELTNGIRKARGRLFPLGFLKILRESRKTRLLTMLLGAIRDDYRNNGLDALMGMKIIESAHACHMEMINSHLVLENNLKMRAEYERLGGIVQKRYRIYSKTLQKKTNVNISTATAI